jgi:hypothetical protein
VGGQRCFEAIVMVSLDQGWEVKRQGSQTKEGVGGCSR